jgi:phosphatidylglycerophosphate synthase
MNHTVLFAGLAGACLLLSSRTELPWRVVLLVSAAACIQLRLLCNLMDGMVAIEGGLKTKSGEIFNDLPDRIADVFIFVPAGYSIPELSWGPELGWVAGLLAVLTAYVRVLGGSTGVAQSFIGPMAKQHRMAVMTAACLLATVEPVLGWNRRVMTLALGVIVFGSLITIIRRIRRIVKELEAR